MKLSSVYAVVDMDRHELVEVFTDTIAAEQRRIELTLEHRRILPEWASRDSYACKYQLMTLEDAMKDLTFMIRYRIFTGQDKPELEENAEPKPSKKRKVREDIL